VPKAAGSAVAPLYLFACLLLGGSAQGIWQNALLQLAGLAIIVWAAVSGRRDDLPRAARPIFLLAMAAIAVVAVQAIPLPAAGWEAASRARILRDYRLLGDGLPGFSIAVAPYASLSTLLCLIPPVAMFCAMVRLNAYRRSWLAAALLTGTTLGILLGALQVVVSADATSPWYLYPETNRGLGVGFFANANHMANLLVISLPFIAALAVAGRSGSTQRYSALLAMLTAAALLVIVGIALNGSLAGYALAVPVIAASALMILPRKSWLRPWIAVGILLAIVAAVGSLSVSSIGATKLGEDASTSIQSREQILETTGQAIADFMPWGSGLGSFLKVYRLYESPATVTSEYVVHAHNDYAELALELGVAGVVLMLLFLAWWARAVWKVWRNGEGGPFAAAASIGSAAILVHSLVDFPLRTAAISVCFAMFVALLADRKQQQRQDSADLRPTRHIVIR
jgi:O-antigen ligase